MRRPQKIKCHLGFAKQSQASKAIKWACERLGVEVQTSTTSEANLNSWTASNREGNPPHIMILDCRAKKSLDLETIAKSVRHGTHGEHVVLIGILKKSLMEREELVVESYLQAGFNRILVDSGSRGYWLNELAMIIHTEVEATLRLKCADLLLTALDHCRDAIQVTDRQDRVIYENNSTEKILGYSNSDWLEKNIWDYQATVNLTESVLAENDTTASIKGSDLVRQKLDHGKTWEGPLSCRRKAGDNLVLETRIIPVSFSASRLPDNMVYVRLPLPHQSLIAENHSDSNQSVSSTIVGNNTIASSVAGQSEGRNNRRSSKSSTGSKDMSIPNPYSEGSVAGGMIRRTSSSKMYHMLTVEAPITKVINILMSAKENSPLYVAQALDKVLDILQANSSNDLFTPELDKERTKKLVDPVTTDLLGALLQNSTRDALHQRRGSSEIGGGSSSQAATAASALAASATRSASIAVTSNLYYKPNTGQKVPLPPITHTSGKDAAIQVALQGFQSWNFDIFALERLTDHRCLSYMGMAILTRFQLHKTLRCSEEVLQNWLTLIEANYKGSNTYHNSTHAADVLHATACFLEQEPVKQMCDGVDEVVALIAAVIHDVDHPGKNSAFLCNSGSDLAALYNDITVLENHHAAFGFKLTMSDERVNIFQNLDRDSFKLIRQGIIDLVLATDMSKHFVHLNKFVSVFGSSIVSDNDGSEGYNDNEKIPSAKIDVPVIPENVAILKRMLIKCADVSNPARPLEICKVWAHRIAEEYFSQTDEEKRLGLTVVMPQFDRATCSIPKSQLGFYDYFIHDMFDVWNGYTELPQLSDQIRTNYSYWQNLDRRKSADSHESG